METLVQNALLELDLMKKGIINTIVNESPFAARVPFTTINGNALLYNIENALAGTGWYLSGETWVEGTPVWYQRSVVLAILGGDADVDNFAAQTRTNVQDLKRATIELKAKAVANEFEKQAIMGWSSDESDNTRQMKGLMCLLGECETKTSTLATDWDAPNNAQLINISTTAGQTGASGALTLDKMDELCDTTRPGRPDALLMSRRSRRKLTNLARVAGGGNVMHDRDQLGFLVMTYGDIPCVISDHIPDNLADASSGVFAYTTYDFDATRAAGVDNSVMFAVKWGDEGLAGLTNGGLQVLPMGDLETKDASRTRIKWYCAMANFGNLSLAGLFNFCPTD